MRSTSVVLFCETTGKRSPGRHRGSSCRCEGGPAIPVFPGHQPQAVCSRLAEGIPQAGVDALPGLPCHPVLEHAAAPGKMLARHLTASEPAPALSSGSAAMVHGAGEKMGRGRGSSGAKGWRGGGRACSHIRLCSLTPEPSSHLEGPVVLQVTSQLPSEPAAPRPPLTDLPPRGSAAPGSPGSEQPGRTLPALRRWRRYVLCSSSRPCSWRAPPVCAGYAGG